MIYLASPYSHPDIDVRVWRFEQVAYAAAHLMGEGHLVFSPITHSHPIAICGISGAWERWHDFDELMIRVCEEGFWILMLDGWRASVGVRAEKQIAESLSRPIRYVTWPDCTIVDDSKVIE